MAATANWCQDCGAATGSPARGTTRYGFGADTAYPVQLVWDANDAKDGATSNSIGPGPVNSMTKYIYLKFGGTFNKISNVRFTVNNDPSKGYVDSRVTIKGGVISTYATPSQTLNSGLTTDFSNQIFIHDGLPVKMSTTGPEAASPTAELLAPGYTQYLATQMQVASGAPAGNLVTVMVVWWDEE